MSSTTFWSLVFEDHLHFILHALGKDEKEHLATARDLLERHNGEFLRFATEVIAFKQELLALSLRKEVVLDLPPTFLNHMLNEAEAALKDLNGEEHVLDLHKTWLLDADGHLTTIMQKLDPVEKQFKKQLKKECKRFHALFCKALEFIGYLRSGEDDFETLQKLTGDAILETNFYLELVSLFAEQAKDGRLLTVMPELMIDHMLREQSYYLFQLGIESESTVDPFRRGVEVPPIPDF